MKKLDASELQGLCAALRQGHKLLRYVAPYTKQHPYEKQRDTGRQRRLGQRLEHSLQIPAFLALGDGMFERADGALRQSPGRFILHPVGIVGRDKESGRVVDLDHDARRFRFLADPVRSRQLQLLAQANFSASREVRR